MPSSKIHPAMSEKARDILNAHLDSGDDAPHMSERALEKLTKLLEGETPEHPEHPEHPAHPEHSDESDDAPHMSEHALETLCEHDSSVLEKFEITCVGVAVDGSSIA